LGYKISPFKKGAYRKPHGGDFVKKKGGVRT